MKNARKIALFLSYVLLLTALAGCKKEQIYTDQLTTAELSAELRDELDDTDFVVAESGYLDDYFSSPSEAIDYVICIASDGNHLDEFGIWRMQDRSVEEISSLLKDYLKRSFEQNRSFYDSYIPQETPKLRDAEVRVFGNYVAYAIMDKEDRTSFFHELEELLTDRDR